MPAFATGPRQSAKNSQMQALLACWASAFCWLTSFSHSSAIATDHDTDILKVPTSPERVLIFKPDVSIGLLHLTPRATASERELMNSPTTKSRTIQARGKIVIPKDTFVVFEANKDFFKNPASIAKLPANAFDGATLKMLSMDDSEDNFCDQALASIGHLKGLRMIDLDKSEVSDEGMKKLAGLTNLESISAFLTPLRGTCLKDLVTLKKLRVLCFESIGLSEDALQYLPQYPSLICLKLTHSQLTDKGMQYIAKCPTIEDLSIGKNRNVDDKGVVYLKNLKSLHVLSIYDTAITFNGILSLKGMKLRKLTLPDREYPANLMAQLKTTFPGAQVGGRKSVKLIDDYTRTIFSPMTR